MPPATYDLNEQILLGPAIVVRPVLAAGASSVDVLLPSTARWYSVLTGQEVDKASRDVHHVPVSAGFGGVSRAWGGAGEGLGHVMRP